MASGYKVHWTDEEIQFIKDNHSKMTNKEIAIELGKTITVTRIKCYELGLKKMVLEYLTEEQTQYIIDNYQTKGDFEIAKDMNKLYPKIKSWNKKMIEKKRKYLQLKRTPAQIKSIYKRNFESGFLYNIRTYNLNRLDKLEEGTIRKWSGIEVIKTNNTFVHYNRYLWEQIKGEIPRNMIIRKINNSLPTTIDNLMMISKKEHAQINSRNRTPKEYKEIQTLINKLNTKIKENEKRYHQP